jgi:trans-2,3-dihydro-3-hydroxyanthranilate isomerase
LDVFAERPLEGNQLGVVLNDSEISSTEMQRIARELNFSETTFVEPRPRADGSWPVRIFTPLHEMPFAGHPSLGTAMVIRAHLQKNLPSEVALQLEAGRVPVRFDAEGKAFLTPPKPRTGEQHDAGLLARLLDLGIEDLDSRFPIEDISTGMPFTFVPIRHLEAVQRARFREDRFRPGQPDAIFLFTSETSQPDNHVHARMFAPGHGVPEDPATGSANACFALYLLRHRYLGEAPLSVRVEQGVEMGRPSRLYLEISGTAETPVIEVGGRVFEIASGELLTSR